jgi:hypothetical protein
MRNWKALILLTFPALVVAASLALFSGCGKKSETKVEPAPDTAMVLPEPPELEPIEEAFPDTEQEPEAVPAQKAKNPGGGLAANGAYTLQVAIYNNERQATQLGEKLKKQGFPAYVTVVEDPTPALSGTYYRVRVGAFASSKAAREYGEANLKPEGIDFWADLKGRDTRPVKQVFKPKAAPPTPAPAKAAPAPVTPAPAPTPMAAPKAVEPPPQPPPATPVPEAAQDTKPAPKLPDW